MIGRAGWRRAISVNPARAYAIERHQIRPRSDLTPADRTIVNECEQPRRRPATHDVSERGFVLLSRAATIVAADPPVDAPAAVAPPFSPNRSTSAGHRSGDSGLMASAFGV